MLANAVVPLAIGLLPVAAYLLMLGLIQWVGRPVVVSRGRDQLVLGLALTGLAVVGPMELFLPAAAAIRFQSAVWLMMLGLWLLCVVLWSLSQRPGIVIYGGTAEPVLQAVRGAIAEADPTAVWSGHMVRLGQRGIELTVEPALGRRTIELRSTTNPQRLDEWTRLRRRVRERLREVPADPSPLGPRLVAIALGIVGWLAWCLFHHEGSVWAELVELFRV